MDVNIRSTEACSGVGVQVGTNKDQTRSKFPEQREAFPPECEEED